jgi:hypothetical protein
MEAILTIFAVTVLLAACRNPTQTGKSGFQIPFEWDMNDLFAALGPGRIKLDAGVRARPSTGV